jgi:hypothetical protein
MVVAFDQEKIVIASHRYRSEHIETVITSNIYRFKYHGQSFLLLEGKTALFVR